MSTGAPAAPSEIEAAFRRVLAIQIARYPRLQAQDLYKLVHQATLGSEHAVPDVAAARAWLERELAELGDGPEEPVVDPISPDGRIVRVHLRPYLAARGDPETLLTAFLRTANEHSGTAGDLLRYGSWAERMARAGDLPFVPAELRGFFAARNAGEFPPAHHSAIFRAAYHPAYRVVAREFLATE